MNKVMLKQKQKQEEKDKKEKKNRFIKITQLEIKVKLLNHFKNHIGETDKTSQEEIFQAIVGVNSYAVDSYSKFYWWSIIEQMIRELRRKDKCFIIKKQGYYFVLKSEEEADYFKNICDKTIEKLERAKIRADEWVSGNKWEEMETYNIFQNNQEKKPNYKPKEEIIDDKITLANKKVNNL